MRPIGILGGTFDPVHNGHLRLAQELYEQLRLDHVRLIPLNSPNHRATPEVTASQRLQMINLAVTGEPHLVVDDRELKRGGISYTIDTLIDLRSSFKSQPLCLIIGIDAWSRIEKWHRWQELLDYAHLVIAYRPGCRIPDAEIVQRVTGHQPVTDVSALSGSSAGKIMVKSVPMLDISATRIRELLRQNGNPRYLMPDSVYNYLREHTLYI